MLFYYHEFFKYLICTLKSLNLTIVNSFTIYYRWPMWGSLIVLNHYIELKASTKWIRHMFTQKSYYIGFIGPLSYMLINFNSFVQRETLTHTWHIITSLSLKCETLLVLDPTPKTSSAPSSSQSKVLMQLLGNEGESHWIGSQWNKNNNTSEIEHNIFTQNLKTLNL